MSMADELAEARGRITYLESALTQDGGYSARLLDERDATIRDLRHQLGEAHKRHKAMADALAVRADENQRLEYELRNARAEVAANIEAHQTDCLPRIAELEASRDNEQRTHKAIEQALANEREQAEAEAARYRAALETMTHWKLYDTVDVPEFARQALAAVEREPSDDLSQWETNGGSVD